LTLVYPSLYPFAPRWNSSERSQPRHDIQERTVEFLESKAICFEFNISRKKNRDCQMVESKEPDSTIASFVFENALSFNVVDSSFAVMVDQCIQFGQQNPERKYKIPTRRRVSGPHHDSAY
jgi:hypothetical protein